MLALSIGGLVLAATAAVLTIALFASARNTFELLGERTVLILDGIESEVRDKLQGASDVVAGVVQELETGRLRNASPQEIHDALSAIVATAPEVEVLLVWDGNLERRLAAREPDGTIVQAGPEPEDNARIRQMLENTPKGARVWGEPVAEDGRAFINVAAQVDSAASGSAMSSPRYRSASSRDSWTRSAAAMARPPSSSMARTICWRIRASSTTIRSPPATPSSRSRTCTTRSSSISARESM